MKKLAGILLLTAAVILTAGCVSTADPIVGTWELTEPVQNDDYSYTYIMTINEDGTGTKVYSYSNEPRDSIHNLVWEKTGENTYQYETFDAFILSEDGKIMTDWGGYTYSLADGEEIIGGLWTETAVDEKGNRATYVFEENGYAVRTVYSEGAEPKVMSFMWTMEDEKQIYLWYYYPYVINEDGTLTVTIDASNERTFEEIDGVWIQTPRNVEYLNTIELFDDGTGIMKYYVGETNEVAACYYWYWEEAEDGKSGVLKEAYIDDVELLEDGTLVDMFSNTLVRVTSA